MTWRLARSIDVLRDEVNAAAPNRSTVSDGTIGDAAHASRGSDHNPFIIVNGVGVVRAIDITDDPARGCDADALAFAFAALIATGAHPACRHGAYVIWRRRIFSFDRRSEGWRTYSGSNPHDKHVHLSVSLDPVGFDSTAPWGVMEDDDMPKYRDWDSEDRKALAKDVADAVLSAEIGKTEKATVQQILNRVKTRLGRQ